MQTKNILISVIIPYYKKKNYIYSSLKSVLKQSHKKIEVIIIYDDQDLKDFLGYDLGVAITGSEKKGITVIVTEGFGEISMALRTFELLKKHEGHVASVNGATQIRAGVMRPEIIIPLEEGTIKDEPGHAGGYLEIGKTLRIIRDPYFGMIGKVSALPPNPQVLGSGSKARVLEVELNSGESVIVPRANVELIEA